MKNGNSADRLKKRLYSIPEAAVYLGFSVWAVRERIWSGELPCIRPDPIKPGTRGRRVLLDIHDLDRWVETRKTTERR